MDIKLGDKRSNSQHMVSIHSEHKLTLYFSDFKYWPLILLLKLHIFIKRETKLFAKTFSSQSRIYHLFRIWHSRAIYEQFLKRIDWFRIGLNLLFQDSTYRKCVPFNSCLHFCKRRYPVLPIFCDVFSSFFYFCLFPNVTHFVILWFCYYDIHLNIHYCNIW